MEQLMLCSIWTYGVFTCTHFDICVVCSENFTAFSYSKCLLVAIL